MPVQFTSQARYGGQMVTVASDDFREFHRALAALAELDRVATWCHQAKGIEAVVPEFHVDAEDNEYFGFADWADPRRTVTFGTHRQPRGPVPFFPRKPGEGYYEPPASEPPRGPQARPTPEPAPEPAALPEGEYRTITEAAADRVRRVLQRGGWDRHAASLMLHEHYGVGRLDDVPDDRAGELEADARSDKARQRWTARLAAKAGPTTETAEAGASQ